MVQLKKIVVFNTNISKKILDCICELTNDEREDECSRDIVFFDAYYKRLWNKDEYDDEAQMLTWMNYYADYEVMKDVRVKKYKDWNRYYLDWNRYYFLEIEGNAWLKKFHECPQQKDFIFEELETATHFLKLTDDEANQFLKLKAEKHAWLSEIKGIVDNDYRTMGVGILKTFPEKFNFEKHLDLIPKDKMLDLDLKILRDSYLEKKFET